MSRLSSLLAPVQKIQLIHLFLSIDVSSAPPAPAAPSLWSGPKAASPACPLPAWVLDGGAGPGKQCWGLSSRAGRSSPPHFLFFNQDTPGDREEAVNSGGGLSPLGVPRPSSLLAPHPSLQAHLQLHPPTALLGPPAQALPAQTPEHSAPSSSQGEYTPQEEQLSQGEATAHRRSNSPQREHLPQGKHLPTGGAVWWVPHGACGAHGDEPSPCPS